MPDIKIIHYPDDDNAPLYHFICEWCEKPFDAWRKDKRFCHDRCQRKMRRLKDALA